MNLFSVRNKVVLITGTSRGIGKSIADTFLNLGAIVIGISKKKNLKIQHRNYFHFSCNLENSKNIKATVKKAIKIKNKIDVLINNAGITKENKKNIEKSFKIFDETININLAAPYQISVLVADALKKNKNGGTIINISSIGGELGFPDNPAYISSKTGLIGLTKSFARDYGKYNINVNAVLPGYFNTDMNKRSFNNKSKRQKRSDLTMLNRWGKMEELVGTIVFLASDEAKYITGQKIIIDGGIVSKGL
tara:strand:+ start:43 stop:789 length:747 start_codon:yes stop_codon:yes gene_type:complete